MSTSDARRFHPEVSTGLLTESQYGHAGDPRVICCVRFRVDTDRYGLGDSSVAAKVDAYRKAVRARCGSRLDELKGGHNVN